MTDDDGRLWGIWLTGGQASDHQCAPFLARQAATCRASTLVADKGYDSDALRIQGEEAGMKVVIPPNSNRKIQYEYDKDIYRLRGRVEQCIGKYKEYRRVATRYDKLAAHYLGFVILAAIRNILKTIC